MANRQAKVNVGIGFTVDKSGLNELESSLQRVYLKANDMSNSGQNMSQGLKTASKTAKDLEKILQDAYNPKMGTINVTRFNQSLKETGYTAATLKQNLSYDEDGAHAFNLLGKSIMNTNTQLVQSNKLLDKMGETMANTIRWSITSSIVNTFASSIQKAYTYTKQLDTSLNNIRIVTGKSADEMDTFADSANKAAKALGASTLDYTKASLIYYQQGLSDTEVAARAETTVKVANITKQTGDAVSEELTAVWNGYRVSAQETEKYIDKLAAVAATTASDLEELSTGMSKVASAANAMGVDFDDLNAQIATIVSVTRQAPESVGTALKTIYARLGDLKVDGVDEFGVKLGEVTSQMKTMGIEILDANGDMRDMSSIMTEVAEKWNTWTRAQQQAAAVAMAGKRQYNNLVALFENWDMYSEAVETSKNSIGTLQKQQDIYMESTEAKLKTLKATWEDFYSGLIDQDDIKVAVQGLTDIVDLSSKVIKNFGGGIKTLTAFGTILTSVFSQQIGKYFNGIIQQQAAIKRNADLVKEQYKFAQAGVVKAGGEEQAKPEMVAVQKNLEIQYDYAKKIHNVRKSLNEEDAQRLVQLQREAGQVQEDLYLEEVAFNKLKEKYNIEDEYVKALENQVSVQNILEGNIKGINQLIDEGAEKEQETNEKLKQLALDRKQIEQDIVNLRKADKDTFKNNFMMGIDRTHQKEEGTFTKRKQAIRDNSKDLLSYIKENDLTAGGDNKNRLKELQDLPVKDWEKLVDIEKEYENILNEIIKYNKDNLKANQELIKVKEEELKKLSIEEEAQNEILVEAKDEKKEFAEKVAAMKKMEDLQTSINRHQAEQRDISGNFDDMLKVAQQGTNIINTITGISSAMSTFAMSINSVNTLIDVWSDKEKNFGDKALQTIMSLGMTIPMLISSYDKLNIAMGSNITLSEMFTLIKTKNIASTQLEIVKIKEKQVLEETNQKFHGTNMKYAAQAIASQYAHITALNEETKAEIKRQIVSENKEKLSLSEMKHLYQLTLAEWNLEKAEDAVTESIKKQKAALASSGWGIAIIAIAAVVTALSAYLKIQEKVTEEQKEQLEKDISENKEKQDLIKSNQELYSSYEKLYKEYKESNIVTDELKNTTLELINAYNIQSGTVLALTGHYDELTRKIREARLEELKSLEDSANNTITAKNLAIGLEQKDNFIELGLKSAGAGLSGLFAGRMSERYYDQSQNKYYSQLKTTYANEGKIKKALTEGGLKENYDFIGSQINSVVDLNDDLGLINYYNSRKELLDYLDLAYKNDKSLDKTRANLREELNIFSEDIDELIEQNKLKADTEIRKEFLERVNANEDLETVYSEIYNQYKEQYKGILSSSNIKSILAEEMGSAGISDAVQLRFAFKVDIEEQTGKKLSSKLEKYIDTLSDQEIVYLETRLNTLPLDTDLEEWVDRNKDILAYQKKVGAGATYKDLLTSYNEKEGFSEESITSLYDNDYGIKGLTQNQFFNLDEGNQLNEMTKAWIQNTQYIVEHREELKNALEEEREAFIEDSGYKELDDKVAIYNASLSHVIEQVPELKGKEEELKDALAAAGDGNKELTDTQETLLRVFEKGANELGYNTEEYKKYYFELNNAEEGIAALDSEIKNLTEAEMDHSLVLEKITQVQKQHDAVIDDAQSAYKTLSSMVEDYNSTHTWTIDNIQTLMTMSDKYVAQLKFENGQLSLNEEGFKALTIAKLQDELATAELQYQTEMNKLATIAEANANDAAAQKAALYAAQLETLGMVAEGTSEQMWDLAAAMNAIDAKGSAELKAAADQATQAYENRKKAVEQGIAQIKSGKGFGAMMGSGSKGGSSKDKEKTFEDEFDRYWEYKKAIDMLDKAMSRLQKTQSKLHGKELIESLKEENELLEKQKANYEALLHAQEREAGELQGKLDYFGAVFKDNGELANYADVTTQMLNKMVSGAISEEAYEDFKKALERYDSLYYSEMQDTLDKLDDARRKQLENNLKAWQIDIDIQLDLTKAKRAWNDFVRDLEQDFRKIYSDLSIESVYDTANFDTYVDDLNTTLQAIHDVENEITKLASVGKSDMFESMSDAQEKLKELGEDLIENGKSLYDLYKSVWDNYIDKLDQASDNLKDINDEFGHITDELEHERKLIELIYGDKAYDKMTKFYNTQQKNINLQIDSLKTQKQFWEDQFNAAYMMNKDDHNVILEDMSTWTEDMRKAYDQMIDSQEALNDKIVDGIDNLTNNYLNKLAETFDNLEKAVWNMNLGDMADDWDRITDLAGEYLDDVEGAYQIQSLANKIDKDINNTNNLKAAQALQAFREKEIAILREKDNLTQDDIDLAEARYQIMLKQIALEDAQNAKTSMKLTRNTSGNWTYQYVADEDDTADKQQELLQAYQNLYTMADNAYQHAMELATGSYQEMQDKIKGIAEDTTLAEEEKMLKIQEIQDTYLPMIEAAVENSELYRQEATTATGAVFEEVCQQDADAYQYLTDLQKTLVDEVKDKHLEDYEAIRSAVVDSVYPEIAAAAQNAFLETNLNSSTAAADVIHQWADDDGESVKAKLNEAIDSIKDNVLDFDEKLNEMKVIAGQDFGAVDKEIEDTIGWLETMGDKTQKMTDKSSSQLDIMRDAVNKLGVQFQELTDKIRDTAEQMAAYKEATAAAYQEMINLNIEKAKFENKNYDKSGAGDYYNFGDNEEPAKEKYKLQSDPYGAKGTLGLTKSDGTYYKITGNDTTHMSVQSDPYGVSGTYGAVLNGKYVKISGSKKEVQDYITEDWRKQVAALFGVDVDQIDFSNFTQFASGGYTGDWGLDHGKLAILHQKELVLNETDTSNFLRATNLLRDISKINGSIEDSIMTSILGMMSALSPHIGGFSTGQGKNGTSGNIFNITAEFPNANDVTSIREAILSLPNLASQYVHQSM